VTAPAPDATAVPPLQYVHVPKCGGNSIRRVLTREYGDAGVHRFAQIETPGLDLLRADLAAGAEYAAYSGHVPFGLDAVIGRPVRPFTVLRHPVDRVVSSYYFVLTAPGHRRRSYILDGVRNLEEYVTRSPVAAFVNNGVARFVGGDATDGWPPATERHLEQGLDRIRSGAITVGLHDRFAESLALFRRAFGWRTPVLEHANPTARRVAVEALDPDTVAVVEAHNAFDLALYAAGQEVFTASVAAAGGLEHDVRSIRWATRRSRWRSAPRRTASSLRRRGARRAG